MVELIVVVEPFELAIFRGEYIALSADNHRGQVFSFEAVGEKFSKN